MPRATRAAKPGNKCSLKPNDSYLAYIVRYPAPRHREESAELPIGDRLLRPQGSRKGRACSYAAVEDRLASPCSVTGVTT